MNDFISMRGIFGKFITRLVWKVSVPNRSIYKKEVML